MKTIFLNKRLEKGPGSVATIGVFDGVHLGHQLVIGKVLEQARQRGLVSTVITVGHHRFAGCRSVGGAALYSRDGFSFGMGLHATGPFRPASCEGAFHWL